MANNDILNEFFQFIYDQEASFSELSWGNGSLYVDHDDGFRSVIKFCLSSDYFSAKQSLINEVSEFSNIRRLELYYIGDYVYDISPDFRIYACNVLDAWRGYPQLLMEEEPLGYYVRSGVANILKSRLVNLATGDGAAYENLVSEILVFSLNTCLSSVDNQSRSYNGRVRRDIVLRLRQGCLLQSHFFYAGLTANNIIVEAKNCKVNEGDHIHQLERYLSPSALASVGFLVTRKPLSHELLGCVADHRRNCKGRSVIVPFDDNVLLSMLENSVYGQFDNNQRAIINIFESVLSSAN
ncbi:hypothetical protein NK214_05675 [Chromobacterium sp. S0633]|uniref:hypothetical protein n=1 Tax=Chromobacterium sp. S0633 TaxID=2957805 RepID=UPI0020A06F5E|nr:hypothetical protein [Chromobacterium sp. S0633]MCP1289676.1 hypothetical protein [Chromobacterium sp. S0633]